MKKIKLNFDELRHNLEVLPYQSLSGIKGGFNISDFFSAVQNGSISTWSQGSYTFDNGAFVGHDPTYAWNITLKEVVITATTRNTSWLQDSNASMWYFLGGYDPHYLSNNPEILSGYDYEVDGSYYDYGGYDYGGYPQEPTCTCELGSSNQSSGTGQVLDSNNLLSGAKTFLNNQKTFLNGLNSQNMAASNLTQAGVDRMLATIGSVNALISRIENSGKRFRIETGTVAGAATGEFLKDTATGEYVVKIDPSNQSNSTHGLLIHELVHAGQMLDGEIGFSSTGHSTMMGMEDEVEAYQLMYDFEAGAYFTPQTVTAASINAQFPNVYTNVPATGGKCPVHG